MKYFALAGNPNCGKTTLFNSLTGSTAHVGNWPGVTVDKRDGVYKKCAEPVAIVDLPGIYSLSPYTPEEVIARNYILDEKPDCVINIVDATNLIRNLYLTTQILEIDVPLIIALNMMDAVEKTGDSIDAKELEKRLGVPVVKISALQEVGLHELMERAFAESQKERKGTTVLKETPIAHLIGDVKIALSGQKVANPLFHAIKLVEGDEIEVEMHKDTLEMVDEFKRTHTIGSFGNDFEVLIADGRYNYITQHFAPTLTRKSKHKFQMTRSDKADRVLTNKWAGIPIFLVILFAIFHLTFSEDFLYLGAIFGLPTLAELGLDLDNYGVRWLACLYDGAIFSPGVIINNIWNNMLVGELFGWIQGLIEGSGMPTWLVGLINNGVIDGVGAVLSFLPPILVLFLFFSILEDSGYMARIAFILDRLLRRFGLSGRAFMPMIMGFGCSVPAMINTRTLADDRERTATVRVIPFFACGAKLPILTAIAGGIVSISNIGNADVITYSMYVLGVVIAILSVLIMRGTTLKGETPPFIMELPAYHAPQFKNLMIHLWDKAKHFIKKAFTVILISTVIIWVLTHFNFSWGFLDDAQINDSILAGLAQLVQPLFTPLGFGSQIKFGWVFVVAIIAGLIAKENVVATLATLAACLIAVNPGAGLGGLDIMAEDGVDAVHAMIELTQITVPALLSFIAFNMTTIPCFAAVTTARSELGKKRFGWTIVFWLVTSYVTGAAMYTIGSWWWTLFIWLAVVATAVTLIILYNKGKIKISIPKLRKKNKSKPSCCSECSSCPSKCDSSTRDDENN
ncbi:MAG: ferrous iron transporter B [Clostridiales bacterium]|nr:ferrous iron transporter B [Clostridiales bacterium]